MIRPVVLEAQDVTRSYQISDDVRVDALRGVSFAVHEGEYVAIVGSSGSGKSTLLNLLGVLDKPTSGVIRYDGRDVTEMTDSEVAQLRNERIGFVFQSFHLLQRVTAVDNVIIPLTYRPGSRTNRRDRAVAALTSVGLSDRLDHRPNQLSGGQQQRVAIARALVTEPGLILADEPTGNLDSVTSHDIMTLLETLHREKGTALVVITHDRDVAERADRQIELKDGVIVNDVRR